MNLEDVTAILRAHVDPGLEAVDLVRGTVGNSQETWFVDARPASGELVQLVLRRTAPAGVLAWTDREQEYNVLRALDGHGLPVPGVLAIGVDERPFLVMERLPGAPPSRLADEERRTLGGELGTLLARLHALDPESSASRSTESPSEATLAQVRHYQRLYVSARPAPVPLLGALLAWAERNCPQDDIAPAVLWGDPGAHNMLVADGHVSALLDWELTHVGDPLDDLGAAVWSCLGSFDPGDVVAGYEEVVRGGRPAAALLLRRARERDPVGDGRQRHGGVDRGGRRAHPRTPHWGSSSSPSTWPAAQAAGWGDLPPSDGQPPPIRSARIRPRRRRASAAGCWRTSRPRSRIGACAR